MSIDITTKEGWNQYLDIICKRFTAIASEEEMRLASCSLILTANPETGEAWPPRIYEILLDFHASSDEEAEEVKNRAAMTLSAIATAGCCIGSAFSSEAWMQFVSANDTERLKNRLPPSKDPERKEGIFLAVNHAEFGPQSRRAMIDTVDGKRKLSDWETLDGTGLAGRFSSFVPPKGFQASPEIVAVMREGIRQLKIMDDIIPIDEFIERIKKEQDAVE